MTNNQIALIKEALLEEELAEMAVIDALPDEEIAFTEKYKIEMQKLLSKHKKRTHNTDRFIPKRLVGVLAAILITLALMMSISAIRKPIVEFIVNVYDGFIGIFVEVEGNEGSTPSETIEVEYMPSYMIKGYTLKSTENYDVLRISIWYNTENKRFEFCQQIINDGFQSMIDIENASYNYKTLKNNTK